MSRLSITRLAALAATLSLGLSFAAAAADQPVAAVASAKAQKAEPHKKAARFDGSRCIVPDSLVTQSQPLQHVAFKLRNDLPIKIVAVGSSSTQGHGASGPSHSYPSRLAVELSELWPRAQITVVNRGVGGERTAQMMARFERDVVAEKPDLVIWQVGTNESLAGDTIHSMSELILEGIDTLETAGADVIIMSPQYAPRFNERADHLLRVEAVRAAAREKNVGVFRRFEIMQNWIARENMTMAAMISNDGLHMNDLSYGCTAHLLAKQIALASPAVPLMAIKSPMPLPASAMNAPGIAHAPMPASPMSAKSIEASAVAAPAVAPSAAPVAIGPVATPISPNIPR